MSQLVLQYIEMCTSANNWYIQKAVETLNAVKKVNSNAFAIDFWYIEYFSQTQPYFWHVDGVSWSTVKTKGLGLVILLFYHTFIDIRPACHPSCSPGESPRSLGFDSWILQVLESGLTPFSLKLLGASGLTKDVAFWKEYIIYTWNWNLFVSSIFGGWTFRKKAQTPIKTRVIWVPCMCKLCIYIIIYIYICFTTKEVL